MIKLHNTHLVFRKYIQTHERWMFTWARYVYVFDNQDVMCVMHLELVRGVVEHTWTRWCAMYLITCSAVIIGANWSIAYRCAPLHTTDLISNVWNYYHTSYSTSQALKCDASDFLTSLGRAGDKFVTTCLKVRFGLLSTLSHWNPTLLGLMEYGWLQVDIRTDRTFQQGVTN